MIYKLLHIIVTVFTGAFILVTLSFSARERGNVPCHKIEINFKEDEIIRISKDEIVRLVRSADDKLIGKELAQINADHIEKEVEKHQAILKAEVYKVTVKDSTAYSGILGVRVSHRIPAVRIMSSLGNYYLDRNGEKIPLSANYAANVLVATGYLTEEFAIKKLLPFVLYIEKDSFWNAQIKQIHIEKSGNILLTPLVGDHLIELGTIENYSDKLYKMRAFYDQVLVRNNWNKYKLISLKYSKQIVAKKR